MSNQFSEIISTVEDLQALLGTPSDLVNNKSIDYLDSHCRDFISKASMLFVSTSDAAGNCDVSPRGDAAGFVLALDEKRLVIPERPGNKRCDTLRNILENPKVGLIFIIPGLEETLRVNGKACIIKDEIILTQLAAQGKVPVVGIGVEVEECYIHCAKAFKRSSLWQPEQWPAQETLPRPAAILADHIKKPDYSEEHIKTVLKESYEKRLY
ncbi:MULTISPECIES: pyridoxamine 5'-phosphate oxidase family protein [Pontibacter]|uniref:Pyridoxamine 5'-phosphate oxidase N-terminal domain-containing protein n=1 Tax=Pontibacter lucknowensis TaxID=1077936 RepID=A0A1N6T3B1_9BACT|nr:MULTISPECIES: pyridoxamine 5'-phosphate oxidase family protein [Pontibacter]EJF09185.1 pyridoxamine 5'-phosphate oxidase-like FMN-binding protein [Pontibacter sp. BAB1700]SIQ47707.1 hypothetical protein SAMN05421545_0094 [Pontibacter lucknowensis]